MPSIFDQEKIKKAAQFPFKNKVHLNNALLEELLIEQFEQQVN